MITVLFLILPVDAAYQAREQGLFRSMIHPCLHPARRRERYVALGKCVLLLLLCVAPDDDAAVLRLLLRLLLLLLLQLLRGFDKNRAGDSRLRVAGHCFTNKTNKEKKM